MLIRCVEVPGTAFWHDSGLSRRNGPVDPWRWNPENTVLMCFRVFKRLSAKEAAPDMFATWRKQKTTLCCKAGPGIRR
eukprot:6944725-Pyramimonas_sp.AAC.1